VAELAEQRAALRAGEVLPSASRMASPVAPSLRILAILAACALRAALVPTFAVQVGCLLAALGVP